MNIRSLTTVFLLAAFLAISLPSASAPSAEPVSHVRTENNEERAQVLLKRLEEIQSKDMKQLTRVERKQLRKEVRQIKHELEAISGGVYLSVGAIIIIILLLILLL